MTEDVWSLLCGQSDCLNLTNQSCNPLFVLVTNPSSCINHVAVVGFDVLLLVLLSLNLICKCAAEKVKLRARYNRYSGLQILSAAVNACVGLIYIGSGFWILVKKLRDDHSVLPIHWWVLYLIRGFTWMLLGLTMSLRRDYFRKSSLRLLSILAFTFSGFVFLLDILAAINTLETKFKVLFDFLSFIGSGLILLCAYKGYGITENGEISSENLYTPLIGEINSSSKTDPQVITPLATAGLFGRMSFWWLNPLMTLGKRKTLTDEDIPQLQNADTADSCYSQFVDQLAKYKQNEEEHSQSSVFWAIVACYWSDILLSGLFAFVKILTVSAGPVLLNGFIGVADGDKVFEYEGYVLVFTLFILKVLESLSQRQWYFRSRVIGIKLKSVLTAAIYKKQQRLSNAVRVIHSAGEIMNYVTVDAYRIGEFPFWLHQTWTTGLQLCIALLILINSVGLATISALVAVIITVVCNMPIAKLQHKVQNKVMVAQDERLKKFSEALVNIKVLKLYAWVNHFKKVIEDLRDVEYKELYSVQSLRSYIMFLFWMAPTLVSAATFGTCFFLEIPLNARNVFTFIATLRLVQEPLSNIPDVVAVVIQAKVAFGRVVEFLNAPELQTKRVMKKDTTTSVSCHAVIMESANLSANLSWEIDPSKPTLNNVNLEIRQGERVAICGEVGSGKSTLLAAILGEVPYTNGTVDVTGRIAYVSQTAWIQTGTIRENILFGSAMDDIRYQETLRICALVKDLEVLPYGDMTEIGERGVNLSGGQKQRIQLARALFQNADLYLLDDPFSAVDANTAASLFNDYVIEALSGKTVLLVTHQVDFLPAFHCCLLMADGKIIQAGSYQELLASSPKFLSLVNAHKEMAGTERPDEVVSSTRQGKEITRIEFQKQHETTDSDQLINEEEIEVGDTGLKPYLLYLNQKKSMMFYIIAMLSQLIFVISQSAQNIWMASAVDNPDVSTQKTIVVYLIIAISSSVFLLLRRFSVVAMYMEASKSLFSSLLMSLFRAPMSFYDSTPLGRILTRVSVDLSIADLDIPFNLFLALAPAIVLLVTLVVLVVITWQVLLIAIPVFYMAMLLQKYYLATAKELMRLNGTTKSLVANHLAESVAGAMTIRAFNDDDRFFAKTLNLIDINASPNFHNFAASEWLILRLETLGTIILAAVALCTVLLPSGTLTPGFVGLSLSYALTLNVYMVYSAQFQCTIANYIVSVERLDQYMHIPSEAPEFMEKSSVPSTWPSIGKVEIRNLQIKYRQDAPLILRGISCIFEGGDRIGIVGRTGSGKTTLIGALFRLVEPVGGHILVDGIDICSVGLHDLRSRFGIIPQEPTLFNGTVRFNLDPLSQHTDDRIWEVLAKCHLKEAVQEKQQGLDSLVTEDGSNWSMGQRQLFCLGRALLRKSRILVLDEATASMDNVTDAVLQKTIRTDFSGCTVITVAHRIPTVMDNTKILAIRDGEVVEFDVPMKLMKTDGSLFGQLVKEYWSHKQSAETQ